jgi:hypothetical protein
MSEGRNWALREDGNHKGYITESLGPFQMAMDRQRKVEKNFPLKQCLRRNY